jgi:phosphate transport system protein
MAGQQMDSEHTIKAFDADLHDLRRMLIEIGELVKSQITDAVAALTKRKKALATQVISIQSRVDALHRHLEEQAIVTIARRQPMAVDLREVVSLLRILADLKRMGELTKNIGKRVLEVTDAALPSRRLTLGVKRLGSLILGLFTAVLDSYAEHDVAKALGVWSGDKDVDDLYASLVRELLTYMMEDPRHITSCLHVMFCAKNLERIGDHATNIAESVYYVIEGHTIADERPKGDSTVLSGLSAAG